MEPIAAQPSTLTHGVLHPAARLVVPDLAALQGSVGRRQRRASAAYREAEELVLAEAAALVEPAFVWARLDAPGLAERLGLPAGAAARVKALLGVVCTIGGRLEARVREHFAGQQYTRGYLLDQVGTLAVALLARHAATVLCAEQRAERWAPGEGEGDRLLEAQRLLFTHVPAHLIGVGLTERNVMTPAKSLSFFLFVCDGPAGLHCLSACPRCLWQGNCERERGRRARLPRAGDADVG